jgi:hypothetical protein
MTMRRPSLAQSTLMMRLVGWGVLLGLLPAFALYPAGFVWGVLPAGFPVICGTHPPSPYDGLHPYLPMLLVVYFAWAILMIRGAKDPLGARSLVDFGVLANLLHAAVMIPLAFLAPNEHAHLWADVPLLLALCAVLWIWRPIVADLSSAGSVRN